MVRTFLLLLVASIAIGVVATPGLAPAALLIVPVAVVAVVWWALLGTATHGRRTEPVIHVKHRELLGPGGPDDPFAPAVPERAPGTSLERSRGESRRATSNAPQHMGPGNGSVTSGGG